jgi:hypothetical protein
MIRNYSVLAISCWEMPKLRLQPIGDKAELPSGYQQKGGNFHPFFSVAPHIRLY